MWLWLLKPGPSPTVIRNVQLPTVPPPHGNYQQDIPWLATEVGSSCKICILSQISSKPSVCSQIPWWVTLAGGRSGPRCAEMPNGQHYHSSSSAASSALYGIKPQSPVRVQDKKHLTLTGLQCNGVKLQLQSERQTSSSSSTKGERTPLFRNLAPWHHQMKAKIQK